MICVISHIYWPWHSKSTCSCFTLFRRKLSPIWKSKSPLTWKWMLFSQWAGYSKLRKRSSNTDMLYITCSHIWTKYGYLWASAKSSVFGLNRENAENKNFVSRTSLGIISKLDFKSRWIYVNKFTTNPL